MEPAEKTIKSDPDVLKMENKFEVKIEVQETVSNKEHPWASYYENSKLDDTEVPAEIQVLNSVTLVQIENFRAASLTWINDERTNNTAELEASSKNTSTDLPTEPFALYMVVGHLGNTLALTPVFIETAAHDRADLKIVRFNRIAHDQLNSGKVNHQTFLLGDIIIVTKLQRLNKVEPSDFGNFTFETMTTPASKAFWEVSQFIRFPNNIRTKVLVSPFRYTTSGGGKFHCIGNRIKNIMDLKPVKAPKGTKIESVLEATINTPWLQSERYLSSLKEGAEKLLVISQTPRLVSTITFSSAILHAEHASEEVIRSFRSHYEHVESSTCSMENKRRIESRRYSTKIDKCWIADVKDGLQTFIEFGIGAATGPARITEWNCNPEISIAYNHSKIIRADVKNVRVEDKLLIVKAEINSLFSQDFISHFEEQGEVIADVHQLPKISQNYTHDKKRRHIHRETSKFPYHQQSKAAKRQIY
ncbi:unnamed protein product [Caenorhabditis angaria]|uniref:Uncharacterized protein n=1 Tax=Caenorhabditis angaria TaxID=860376 RepID=A0A9P1J095_9PELO|nr:unnamed protein product [Caenorhabditis angaria]